MSQSPPSLSVSDLQPGDVLLSLGVGDLSDAIRGLDGGLYSHAAIWSGDEVIEATLPKVQAIALEGSRAKARYIDVYRYKDGSARSARIVSAARGYLGAAYAEADLLLATAVLSISAWMPGEWSELNLLFGAGQLRRLLEMVLRLHRERPTERVTCVGLAARAHLAADLPIEVRLQSGRRFDGRAILRAIKKLLAVRTPRPAADGLEAMTADTAPGDVLDDLLFLEELERRLDGGAPARPLREPEGGGEDIGLEAIAATPQDASWLLEREYWERALAGAGAISAADEGLEATVEELRERRLIAGKDWSAALVTPRQLQVSDSLALVGRVWASATA